MLPVPLVVQLEVATVGLGVDLLVRTTAGVPFGSTVVYHLIAKVDWGIVEAVARMGVLFADRKGASTERGDKLERLRVMGVGSHVVGLTSLRWRQLMVFLALQEVLELVTEALHSLQGL